MPWDNTELHPVIQKARNVLQIHFDDAFETPIRICKLSEIRKETIREGNMDGKNETQIKRIQSIMPFMRGKFFHSLQQIWLVEEKGENLFTIVHELIHSIQKCAPKRETITFFICYKILDDSSRLTKSELNDWLAIEKMVGFERIKTRLFTPGHCEEF